nr:immunoglobulin heavy chain junction region [Mus musculus]
CVRRDLW